VDRQACGGLGVPSQRFDSHQAVMVTSALTNIRFSNAKARVL
jgi:hypothetical protein